MNKDENYLLWGHFMGACTLGNGVLWYYFDSSVSAFLCGTALILGIFNYVGYYQNE